MQPKFQSVNWKTSGPRSNANRISMRKRVALPAGRKLPAKPFGPVTLGRCRKCATLTLISLLRVLAGFIASATSVPHAVELLHAPRYTRSHAYPVNLCGAPWLNGAPPVARPVSFHEETVPRLETLVAETSRRQIGRVLEFVALAERRFPLQRCRWLRGSAITRAIRGAVCGVITK